MIIANIQSLNEADRNQVLGHFGQKFAVIEPLVSAKELKVKKNNVNKGRATCWGDYSKKILSENKDAILAFKVANPETKGSAHLVFMANYRKEHAEEFAAFEAKWKEVQPKETVVPAAEIEDDAVTVVDDVDAVIVATVAEKPKRVMTDEQKAKMKAGREMAKAKKYAAGLLPISPAFGGPMSDPVVAPVPPEAPVAPEVPEAPVAAKKRGPKKLNDMTHEERTRHDARKAERKAKKAAGLSSGSDTGSEATVPSTRSVSPKLKDE